MQQRELGNQGLQSRDVAAGLRYPEAMMSSRNC